jgi:glycosidase
MSGVHHLPWWKQVVIYQVYPSSFADANGDGISKARHHADASICSAARVPAWYQDT